MIRRPHPWLKVLAVLLVLVTSACSGPGAMQTEAPATPSSSDHATSDLEALYWARQDSARADFTAADVRFMTMMIKHHAQALVMSRLAPENGASEQVQTLAARIINAQQDEIATMQRWLRTRGQPVPDITIEGTSLTVDGMTVHGMDMAGVLTQAQIDELDAARGTAFDRLFLTYMIEHHRGATAMVDTLFNTDGAAQDEAAFKLASDINVDQTTEIARMEQMLRGLSSETSQDP
jgi:uncharacterized protein (DUF305 family)